MKRSNSLFWQFRLMSPRPSRCSISTTPTAKSSTSPQRCDPDCKQAAPRSFHDIPGPLALPMLRHSAHVLPRIGSFHHVVGLGLLEGLRSRYGDLVRLAKGSRSRPVLYVFDPEVMREVYESSATEPPRWEKSPLIQQRTSDLKRCPVQEDEKKRILLALRALLLDSSLLKNYDKALDEIANDATRRLGELRSPENVLNEELITEIYRWALESLGMIMLGMRLGCLDGSARIPSPQNSKPENSSLDDDVSNRCTLSMKSFEELSKAEQLVLTAKEIGDSDYLIRSEDTLKANSLVFQNALKAFDRQFCLIEEYLEKAVNELNEARSSEVKPEQVLLDKLQPLKHRLLPITADLILSGVDPLTQSAVSMLYQLSLNAARQQRAHDEVSWAAASRAAGAAAPEAPYGGACAREALRLHPPTGGVVRRSTGALVLAGYEVPVGVDIVLAHGVSSKSEKEWGRANAFIPERWCERGPLHASRAHPISSLPFGESCPAEGIVGKILTSLVSRVIEKYRLEWHGPAPKIATSGCNKIEQPYYFVLQNAA